MPKPSASARKTVSTRESVTLVSKTGKKSARRQAKAAPQRNGSAGRGLEGLGERLRMPLVRRG